MSSVDAVRRLIQKGAVAKPKSLTRYSYRERFGEFSIRDGQREMAVCSDKQDAKDIVDALELLWKTEGKR